MATLAFARSGRTESCAKAADYLVGLLEAQPHFDRCMYTEGEDSSGVQILQWNQSRQAYYKVGLFVVALVDSYGVTGSQTYLETATAVYRHCTERAVDLWTCMMSHKMVWAASMLHAVTGESHYAEDACRLADHIATLQNPDGSFHYPEVWTQFPPDPWDLVPNLLFQAGLWLVLARDAFRAGAG
jgi:hypothetical protein